MEPLFDRQANIGSCYVVLKIDKGEPFLHCWNGAQKAAYRGDIADDAGSCYRHEYPARLHGSVGSRANPVGQHTGKTKFTIRATRRTFVLNRHIRQIHLPSFVIA